VTVTPDEVRAASGLEVVGAFAFGDSPALADELLAFVGRGTKRATAGAVAELEEEEPFPEPGQRWALLDGRGTVRYVMETVEVACGRLRSVTPAFAWDEGEEDRTREQWLAAHRAFFQRRGATEPEDLEVVFERFRIVWPEPDGPVWLTPEVREVGWDERVPLADRLPDATVTSSGARSWSVGEVPAVVQVDGERPVALAAFVPRPSGTTEVVAAFLDLDTGPSPCPLDLSATPALARGLDALARREGWVGWQAG
jgi:uncharacterized protein YhfF